MEGRRDELAIFLFIFFSLSSPVVLYFQLFLKFGHFDVEIDDHLLIIAFALVHISQLLLLVEQFLF